MNIPPEVARAQAHHGAKGAAHGIKGGRPRLALTEEERAERRREQYTAYRRRKGIMPKMVLTQEQRQQINRELREARLNKEYRRVWRKSPGVLLTEQEFEKRLPAFRRWVRAGLGREWALSCPVNFVRRHYREERRQQRAEQRANDSWEDDDDELLQLAAEQELRARFVRDAEIQNLISSALPPEPVGRNQPCTCGSGRKFKKCCGK
jgi:hypothetical protein